MFKVGDRVKDLGLGGICGVVAGINAKGELSIHWDGQRYDPMDTVYWLASDFVKVEPESPVRTVTRKEIVEGTYGPVRVGAHMISVDIRRDHACADRLREAIATLQTLLGALE